MTHTLNCTGCASLNPRSSKECKNYDKELHYNADKEEFKQCRQCQIDGSKKTKSQAKVYQRKNPELQPCFMLNRFCDIRIKIGKEMKCKGGTTRQGYAFPCLNEINKEK